MSVFALCLAGTGLALVLTIYLGRLPEAPHCPSCRRITGESDRFWAAGRALSHLSTTALRECRCCGWRGRMRWRPSPTQVRDG